MSAGATPAAIALPRDLQAVAMARRAVERHAGALDADELDAARLLVSELVTNAVRHGQGEILLGIHVDDAHVRFEVSDEGGGRPARRSDPGADGGFGLNLVDALAARWGADGPDGRVWFELPRARADQAPSAPTRPAPPVIRLAPPLPRRETVTAGAFEATRSVLAPVRWSVWALFGAAIALVLSAADLAIGQAAILTALLVLAPLTCALLGCWGDTAAVTLLSVVLAIVASVWHDGAGSAEMVAFVVVAVGGALSVLVALLRAAAAVNLKRFQLLSAVADVGNETMTLDDAVARLLDILVPAFADMAMLDTTSGGPQQRLGARASGPNEAAVEAALLARRPNPPEAPAGPSRSIHRGHSQHVQFDDDLIRAIAHDEDDLSLLRSFELGSGLFVPLRARAHTIGALSALLGPSGRSYSRSDLAFAEVFSGRIAVALDNAGLTRELSAAERQLDAVLDALAEAVTVVDGNGKAVYVNDAAVALLRLESAEQFLSAEPGETMDLFAVYDEDGEPVDLERLPSRRVLAGERDPKPLLVRNIVKATGEERWLMNKTSTILDEHDRVVRVINVIEDVTETKRTELAQRLLSAASEALGSSLDYGQTLQRIAEVAVPTLADWCGVDLPGKAGLIESVAVAHVDSEKVALARRLRERYPVKLADPGGIADILRGGPSLVVAEIPDADLVAYAQDEEHLEMLRATGMASLMIVPLTAGGQTLGALTLARTDPLRMFDAADLRLAEELGRRAGTAVLNARLYTERSAIAQTLQRGLRPPELRELPGFAAASLYRAAGELNEVGGDFFDVFMTDEGWMLVVGDVAGQGAEAATLTGLARYTLRSVAQLTGCPVRAVQQLNATLRDQPEMSLCTAVCAHLRVDPAAGVARMALANCGHPLPLLLRDGQIEGLGEAGPMAGAFDEGSWEGVDVELRPGDALFLYTDGVLDTVGADGRFGEERLWAALRSAPTDPQALVDHVAAALDAFQDGGQRDDTAIVAVRFLGVPDAAA